MAASDNTTWNINTDVYDIHSAINNLQKRFLQDEDETTLSLGTFGFISDVETKKIQTATIMVGELGNEMFPSRAKLTKNVLMHAVYTNIQDLNAVPAEITLTLCIKESDFTAHAVNNTFFVDSLTPIFIGDINKPQDQKEFHLDFDVLLKRVAIGSGKFNYSAQYVVEDNYGNPIINRISKITNPYLKTPFIINIGNESYVAFQATLHQVTIEEINDTMTSDSIIENKSYEFTIDQDQLADFRVVVTDTAKNETTEVIPYMYGGSPTDDEIYCWYMYIDENTIRIVFDSKSYVPGLNSQIYIKVWTTKGYDGNFDYLDIDGTSEGFYVSLYSDKYGYDNIITFTVAVTNSDNGSNRKTKEQLQKLIPKAALSRGAITTETDLINYFNLIDNESNRLVMQKKVDNQASRVWYGYFVLKDDLNNIIPTNTIKLRFNPLDTQYIIESGDINPNDHRPIRTNDGRIIIPAGTCLRLNTDDTIDGIPVAEIIDDGLVPDNWTKDSQLSHTGYYNDKFYYYRTIYNLVIDEDPLYAAFYLTVNYSNSYYIYDFVNMEAELQFIANRFHFERNLFVDQDVYKLTFSIAQSINTEEYNMYKEEEINVYNTAGYHEVKTITTQNVRVILVLYKEGVPYRWRECDLIEAHTNTYIFDFGVDLITNNTFDNKNRVNIENCYVAGSRDILYGYVDENTKAKIYILAKLPSVEVLEHPRQDLDDIAPGYDDYIVTNIYECVEGLNFYENFTDIMEANIDVVEAPQDPSSSSSEDEINYIVTGVPAIGCHYLNNDTNAKYLVDAIQEKKSYIDYCLTLVENSIGIDYKFFNTYGRSLRYTINDFNPETEDSSIGSIDITMSFTLSLKDNNDITTKNDIIDYIKNYVENVNDIGDFHGPNLVADIISDFSDRINFIEFTGFNGFGSDQQHILEKEDVKTTIPAEFINIRNYYDEDTQTMVPLIDIKIV